MGVTDAEGNFRISGRSWVRDLSLSVNVDTDSVERQEDYESYYAEVVHGWDEVVLLSMLP